MMNLGALIQLSQIVILLYISHTKKSVCHMLLITLYNKYQYCVPLFTLLPAVTSPPPPRQQTQCPLSLFLDMWLSQKTNASENVQIAG